MLIIKIDKYILLLFTFILWSFLISFSQTRTDSLLHELKICNTDTGRLHILNALYIQKDLSLDSAIIFSEQALEIARTKATDTLYATTVQGIYQWNLFTIGDKETAARICWKLLEDMQFRKYTFGMGAACKFLGVIYLYQTLDSSMYYHLKAIEYFKTGGYELSMYAAMINLGSVYMEMHKYKEAIEVSKVALEYFHKINNTQRAGVLASNISACYSEMSLFPEAIQYAKLRLKISEERNEPEGIASVHLQMGEIYSRQKNYAAADKEFALALKTIRNLEEAGKLSNPLFYCGIYLSIAKSEMLRGRIKEVIANGNLALGYLKNNKEDEVKIYDLLYQAYRNDGNYKAAFENYTHYIAARDSYQSADRLNKIDALEARYQNKEKQSQIELLNKEKEIQQERIERQQFIRNSIIILSVVLFAFGGLLFNRFKLKKKIESQRAIINERKRISTELHDDLGAQLSTARMFLNKLRTNTDGNNTMLDNSLNLIDSSISDLRKIMDDLHTSTLQEKGYVAATEELVNKINLIQQINFRLGHHGIDKRLGNRSEHNLYRITQELINNTMKYAKAKNVSIDLVKRDDKIVLMYEDDGTGFDVTQVKRGYGLNNIESRVKSLDGSVEFDSAPGKGFRCIIEIAYQIPRY